MLNRRAFLQQTMSGSAIALAASCGLLAPVSLLAAWNKSAFEAKGLDSALKVTGDSTAQTSGKIKIKAPDIAENGAVVPITVSSTLSGVKSISIYAAKNPTPLSAVFSLGDTTEAYVSTRIKMGKTADVVAVVVADGKKYMAKKEVKVTIGGCGG